MSSGNIPRLTVKKPELDWDVLPLPLALQTLQEHLQTAVTVELYTIPLYLFAAYSIKPGDQSNGKVVWEILNVVKEEMLHLGLAGNVLCSIGGTPHLTGTSDKVEYTPTYPRILFESDPIYKLSLRPASKDTIELFKRVERPREEQRMLQATKGGPIIKEYETIGEFYAQVKLAIEIISRRMDAENRQLFSKDALSKQLNARDGSWDNDDMTPIGDLASALSALDLIINQGEGTDGKHKHCHYQVFSDIVANYFQVSSESPNQLQYYDVMENIDAKHYEDRQDVYKVMLASDAAYTYLLLTVEKLWDYSGYRREDLIATNVTGSMRFILRPLAQFLVRQEITGTSGPGADEKKHFGPPFRSYDFPEKGKLKHFRDLMEEVVELNNGDEKLKQTGRVVNSLIDLEKL